MGKTQDNKWIAFNRYSTEYFANQATDNFAFQRIGSRALKIGIVATHAKAELNQKWYILGGRKEGGIGVHVLGVGGSQQVSSREVDKVIGKYSELDLKDVVVEARIEDGYSFIIVHLPNETLLFNETVAGKVGIDQSWSILKGGTYSKPGRGIHGVFEPRLGQWVYGDKETNRIGILDDTVATQYGEIAEWVLYTPFMYLDGASIDQLEIEIIPGHTVSDDATVFVSTSQDGVIHGKEYTMDYGGPYQYSQRFVRYRFGYVRDWVGFKLRGVSSSRMAFGRGFIKYG